MFEPASPRAALKRACLDRLEAVAREHPAGHQGKLAARYVLQTSSGDRISMMFEKHYSTPAYLWMEHSFAKALLDQGIPWREYPATQLYQAGDPGSKPRYGRHAALQTMRDLTNAHLVRFEIRTIGEMDFLMHGLLDNADQGRP